MDGVYKDDADITLYPAWVLGVGTAETPYDDFFFDRDEYPAEYSLTFDIIGDVPSGTTTSTDKSIYKTGEFYQDTSYRIKEGTGLKQQWWNVDEGMYTIHEWGSGVGGTGSYTRSYPDTPGQISYELHQSRASFLGIWYAPYKEDGFVRTGSEKLLGRDCAIFIRDMTLFGVSLYGEYWVDKMTGCLLKTVVNVDSADDYTHMTITCTEYIVGSVALPPVAEPDADE